jgi:hypothetical protein
MTELERLDIVADDVAIAVQMLRCAEYSLKQLEGCGVPLQLRDIDDAKALLMCVLSDALSGIAFLEQRSATKLSVKSWRRQILEA